MANKSINDRVANRLRTMRLIMGLTQAEVAEKLDFSRQQLQKYEAGESRISFDTLESISAALGSTSEKVLGDVSDTIPALSSVLMGIEGEEMQHSDNLYEIIRLLGHPKYHEVKIKLLFLMEAVEAANSTQVK